MACTTIFTNGNQDDAAVDWTPSPTPKLIRGTIHAKGTWATAKLVVTATANSIGSFPVATLSAVLPDARNIEIVADKITFDITNGDGVTESLTVVFCEA